MLSLPSFSSVGLGLLLTVGLLVTGCSNDTPAPSPSADDRAASAPETPAAPDADQARRILVLGNSIAAGYGLAPEQAFPALLQQKIDSLDWDFEVVNAGVSGETTAGGLSRLDWLLREPVAVLILELGGNDGLRGTPPEATRNNLEAIIDQTRARYPDARILLAGMQVPTNLGPAYTSQFRSLYPDIAEAKDTELIPFLLEGVGGIPELNQPDGIHPTAEGQVIVAENVWDVLKPVLQELRQPSAEPDV
jgi:acyl-CoA thioesterase-1